MLVLNFSRFKPIYRVQEEYGSIGGPVKAACPNTNFLKGCKWSPDGACLLTASDDNWLRVYDLPPDCMEREAAPSNGSDSFLPAVRCYEGETVYDYTWFPAMQAADPVSCVFASTSRGHPLHLWDACTGELRCSYRAYNAVDEVTAAYSVAFSEDGSKVWGGFNRMLRCWDTSRPGRSYQEVVTHRKKEDGQPGIISCMDFNPDRGGMMAVGAYSGTAALYDSRTRETLFLLQGQAGGLTQVLFGRDGNFLFTGARRDPDVWCWDVRYATGLVYKLQRETRTTNQRMQFDIEPCGRTLATGGQDGSVRVFDLAKGEEVAAFRAAGDTVNGFHFHPCLPLAATASGHRRYAYHDSSDEEAAEGPSASSGEAGQLCYNALLVWRLGHSVLDESSTLEFGALEEPMVEAAINGEQSGNPEAAEPLDSFDAPEAVGNTDVLMSEKHANGLIDHGPEGMDAEVGVVGQTAGLERRTEADVSDAES